MYVLTEAVWHYEVMSSGFVVIKCLQMFHPLSRRICVLQSVMDVRSRYLIHTGDLVEIDAESFLPIQKVHAFLLNDSLMFATWSPHRYVQVYTGMYRKCTHSYSMTA